MVGRIGRAVRAMALFVTIVVASSAKGGKPSSVVPKATPPIASEKVVGDSKSIQTTIDENGHSRKEMPSTTASKDNLREHKGNGKTVSKKKRLSAKTTKASSSSPESTSLRRIKREYKDAVGMGIAYDWVKGKLVQPSSKVLTAKTSSAENHHLMCIGPLATNLRHWHFSFRGCGIYEAGLYHGRILLPKDYPATPPRVQLWTPSGRFVPYADICLSASAYHPESWTPRWTVQSLVQALRLHMLTNAQEIGGMTSSVDETLGYAKKSLVWNLTWKAGKTFISVDHANLIAQGALNMDSSEDELESEPVEEAPIEHEISSDGLSNEAPPKSDTLPLELSQDSRTEETAERSTIATTRPKKSKSNQKGKKVATTKARTPQKRREDKQRQGQSLALGIRPFLESPARIAILSLFLLWWILMIP